MHQWDFQNPAGEEGEYAANRRAYAALIAAAVKTLRKKAARPTVTGITPTSVKAKSGQSVIVAIIGSDFSKKYKAQFKWNDIKTTYKSSTELQAVIPAALVSAGSKGKITVYNKKGGGASDGFTIFSAKSSLRKRR